MIEAWSNMRTDVDLGGFSAHSLRVQSFLIDGGAMYGVVPRSLWERNDPPDAQNRIVLDINVILLETPSGPIIVDTGFGDVMTERQRKMYPLTIYEPIEDALARFGHGPEDVVAVVFTHLHFDHAGGAVKASRDGELVPRFPRARHVVQAGEWEDCQHPNERTSATYFPERLAAIERAGLFDLVDGEALVVPGLRVRRTGGHTPHHQAVQLDGGESGVVAPGDIVPSQFHLRLPYVAGIDTHPLDTLEVKRTMLSEIAKDGWWLASDHDRAVKLSRLVLDDKGNYTPAE